VFVAVVAHARYGHPLRFYITPHCPQCPAVAALKLRLVPVTASRPSGEGNRRYAKWPSLDRSHSRRRFPVVGTPYAPPSARPCGCRGTRALVRRCALCGWSVACGQSCRVCPRPPLCFAAARHQPCALVCPSAPHGGSLSPRAAWVGFATCFVACRAGNTGASGLTACKPAWPLAYFSGAIGVAFAIYFIAACARSTRASGLFCM
jgi:hypothetical protein